MGLELVGSDLVLGRRASRAVHGIGAWVVPLSPYNQAFVCVLRIFMQEDSVYRTITFLSHVRIYVQQ